MKVNITLNGKKLKVEGNRTILEVAANYGVHIPHLCYYEKLSAPGACRLCLVEVDGGKIVTSCNYQVYDGMVINTESESAKKARMSSMYFMLSMTPYSPILQDYSRKIGLNVDQLIFEDLSKDCIDCGLCVRICNEIMNKGVIDFIDRSHNTKVSSFYQRKYWEICKDCGACLFTCPTSKITLNHLGPDYRVIKSPETKDLEDLRKNFLRILAKNYPRDAVLKYPNKLFHKFILEYDLLSECNGTYDKNLVDDSHPYIYVDLSRCIGCGTCVRVCAELEGQFVWSMKYVNGKILPQPDGENLLNSSCVSCGACVDACPTGALEDRTVIEKGEPEKYVKTTCVYCGVGCRIEVGVKDGKIINIKGAYDSPVNRGHLCVKGKYAFSYIESDERVLSPMVRKNGKWIRVDWDTAISTVAQRITDIKNKYGPDAISILGSARATNEENYLTQKFARVVIGTNNVDCCARVCHAPSARALEMMLGTGASTNSFEDIEFARTIMVCGANPTENHPVVGARIKQAFLRGANLIVIDPRKTDLASIANIHLQLSPGTDILLFNAMAYTIIQEKLYDEEFITNRTTGFEDFSKFVQNYSPEKVESICGVKAQDIRKAARIYATEKPSFVCSGLGLSEHSQGTENVCALINLALLTGNVGKRGSGVNPLRGQNNVQGSAHMGCVPTKLTGFVSIQEGKEIFEKVWGTKLPLTKGIDAIEIIDAMLEGKLKALYVIGWDILLSHPNYQKTKEALKNLEFLVIQDPFLNKTAQEFGDVFLPTSLHFEKEGTFMNAERRINKVNKVIEPRLKADWEIICDLAKKMGYSQYFSYSNPKDIWEEIRKVWIEGEGIDYESIEEHGGIQWPATKENPDGTAFLYEDGFSKLGKASFKLIEHKPVKQDGYQFKLMTGRTLFQFNAGTFTTRTQNNIFYPDDFLFISPPDAQKLSLKDGDKVRVRSKEGELVMICKIDEGLKEGELYTTFHFGSTNKLTTYDDFDSYVHTPRYKMIFVNLEKV